MARRIRDAKLDSRTARAALPKRGKPYWRFIEKGLYLGYRRTKRGSGTWWARHYIGDQQYAIEPLGQADDDQFEANGDTFLNFDQALAIARSRKTQRDEAVSGRRGPITVKQAIVEYIDWLEAERTANAAADARCRAEALIYPSLGDIEVESLRTDVIRSWLAELARAPRRRGGAGPDDGDATRRRRSTANRTLTILRAALNRLWHDEKVRSNAEWKRVKPFKSVDAARVRYLTIEEARRLINAADADFRPLAQAALHTGARYGELARLVVADFNPDSETIAVRISKSGKARHVELSEEGVAFFRRHCAGRAGSERMFASRGGAWGKSHQARPMREACQRANIKPSIGFHGLRHTWASLAVMNGVPLLVVARNLGHSDTRMVEKHYGHMAPSYVRDAIRAGAPQFGIEADRAVVALAKQY